MRNMKNLRKKFEKHADVVFEKITGFYLLEKCIFAKF